MVYYVNMDNINYYHEMKNILNNITQRKRLLLHSCCAPCSSYCLELLNNYFDIDILFYNPNIDSCNEFYKRLNEQKKLVQVMPLQKINIFEIEYNEQEFLNEVKGYETQPEGALRCKICYKLRMRKTAEYAKQYNYDYFSTTLSISPHKNAQWINELGLELAQKLDILFLQSDFKKNEGFKKSIELSKLYHLYRQNYCGCRFSKR